MKLFLPKEDATISGYDFNLVYVMFVVLDVEKYISFTINPSTKACQKNGVNEGLERKGPLKIDVYSAKERSVDELAWCAFCQEVKPLLWKDGRLFCYEMKFYPKGSRIAIIDSCIADMPTYKKSIRVEGAANIPSILLPVVKASAMAEKILEQTLDLLEGQKSSESKRKPSHES